MKNNSGTTLKYYLELSKLKVMIPVSLTGFTGYFIFYPHITFKAILVTIGILLIAISASVLNQIQEIKTDSIMTRTKARPLPSGKIKVKQALVFLILTLVPGIIILYYYGNLKAAIIAIFTILCYNGIYTYLKVITAFAVVPGAITGALPPVIGWVAAGGSEWDKTIVFVGFLIFIGQIPHFWLLILQYGEEYKKAGFPTLTQIFSPNQIRRLTFTWVLSSVIAALFLCYFEIIWSGMIIGILMLGSTLLILQFIGLLRSTPKENNYKRYSIILNSYFLFVLLLLVTDRIISVSS